MKIKLVILSVFFLMGIQEFGHCQTGPAILYLDKRSLEKLHVKEIKDFSKPTQNIETDDNTSYDLLHFEKGLLDTESYISSDIVPIPGLLPLNDTYSYNVQNQLMRMEHYEGMNAHEGKSIVYKYANGLLRLKVEETDMDYGDDNGNLATERNIKRITKWFYYPDKRPRYYVEFKLNIDVQKLPENQLTQFSLLPEADEGSKFLINWHAKEHHRVYFLYEKRNLVGIYPSKNQPSPNYDINNSLYEKEKINELKKIGFESFSKKYFSDSVVFKKVVEDSYRPVKYTDLQINGLPIKQFLIGIGKPQTRYIILQPTYNYFLFYKLID